MNVPPWLLVVVAIWVIAFGLFRFYLARERRREPEPDRPNFRQKGFYAQSPRRHAVFGVLYLLMGGVLIAMAFGWQPPIMGRGCSDAQPAAEPAETTIEVQPTP